jgi:hypothetical protein
MSAWDERLLALVVDRLVPADADAGALAAGTDRYVARVLAEDGAGLGAAVAAGLRRVDELARTGHGAGFADLPPEARDAVLQHVEGEAWFAALADLAAEGFYADPGNGGNDGAVSWRMIGYADPRGEDGAAP